LLLLLLMMMMMMMVMMMVMMIQYREEQPPSSFAPLLTHAVQSGSGLLFASQHQSERECSCDSQGKVRDQSPKKEETNG
jgi:hypothetical protein